MQNKTEMTPWRKKKPILRWHSYQSLVLGARMKAPELWGVCVKRHPFLSHKRRYNEIERRGHGVTIRRGGPHRQTERLERSLRSHSAFCRHVVVFCADFIHAKRRTVVGLVQPYLAVEPSCAKFHWADR